VFALCAGTGALLFAEPDGQPSLAGDWIGKAKYKGYDMSGEGENEKGKLPIQVEFLQRGSYLYAAIYVEEGPEFELEGQIGGGHFWLFGETEDGPMICFGHVKSKGRKIKAHLQIAEGGWMSDVVIQLKRAPEPVMPK
ncbi:MAG: hypothetical protein ABFS86_12505, partial [Planctomycetota bacterium]